MRRLWESIEALGLDAHLLLQVHDEVILEVKEEDLDVTMQIVYHMLDDVMPIEFPIEPEVGINWAEMKPYEHYEKQQIHTSQPLERRGISVYTA